VPDADRLAVARATLATMGLTVADLLAAAAPAPPTQTVAEYLPTVRAAAGPSRSKTYCPYWDRLGASTLACRPLGEVRTSDLLTWVTAVKRMLFIVGTAVTDARPGGGLLRRRASRRSRAGSWR
jgi:hypothetical protein